MISNYEYYNYKDPPIQQPGSNGQEQQGINYFIGIRIPVNQP